MFGDIEKQKKPSTKILLKEFNIPLHEWGIHGAKSIADLEFEIKNMEAELVVCDNEILRVVKVLNIKVLHLDIKGDTYQLNEECQIFKDGTLKKRSRMLGTAVSEKMKAGESVQQALERALHEELGITAHEYTLINPQDVYEQKESQNYPGLKTRYHFVVGDVYLNESDYRSSGYSEHEVATGITTHFVWEKLV